MRLRHIDAGRLPTVERTVEIAPQIDGYTVADLAVALDGAAAATDGLTIDGEWHDSGASLAAVALRDGARIEMGLAIRPPQATTTGPGAHRYRWAPGWVAFADSYSESMGNRAGRRVRCRRG